MTEEDIRGEFQRLTPGADLRWGGGRYTNTFTQHNWQSFLRGWNAAIRLPPPHLDRPNLGDWVLSPAYAKPFIVVAIDGDTAWLKNRHDRTWCPLVALTRCEAPND